MGEPIRHAVLAAPCTQPSENRHALSGGDAVALIAKEPTPGREAVSIARDAVSIARAVVSIARDVVSIARDPPRITRDPVLIGRDAPSIARALPRNSRRGAVCDGDEESSLTSGCPEGPTDRQDLGDVGACGRGARRDTGSGAPFGGARRPIVRDAARCGRGLAGWLDAAAPIGRKPTPLACEDVRDARVDAPIGRSGRQDEPSDAPCARAVGGLSGDALPIDGAAAGD